MIGFVGQQGDADFPQLIATRLTSSFRGSDAEVLGPVAKGSQAGDQQDADHGRGDGDDQADIFAVDDALSPLSGACHFKGRDGDESAAVETRSALAGKPFIDLGAASAMGTMEGDGHNWRRLKTVRSDCGGRLTGPGVTGGNLAAHSSRTCVSRFSGNWFLAGRASWTVAGYLGIIVAGPGESRERRQLRPAVQRMNRSGDWCGENRPQGFNRRARDLRIMVDLIMQPAVQLVFWLLVLIGLTAVGWYIVQSFRGGVEESETTSEMLSKFREMRQQGYLGEEEFRNIRTHLGEKLKAELKRDEQGG